MPGRSTLTATICAGVAQRSRGGPAPARRRRPAARSRRRPRRPAGRARARPSARASSIGKGGSLSCSTRELGGELGTDHVGPGREELAELDVGRAERGDRAQDRRLRRIALVAEPLERPAEDARGDPQRRRRVEGLERQPHRAGALEGRAGPDQAPEIVRAAHGLRASSRSAARRCPSRGCGSGPGSKPAAADHRGEGVLVGKAADRFDEVLVARAVAGDRLPERRDDVEGVAVVEPAQRRLGIRREFEHDDAGRRAAARGRPRRARPGCG